jgi:hypothetical protein
MKRTYLYPSTFKFLAAIMIVMMALSSLPVSPASAATSTLVAWTKAYDQVSGTGTTTSFAIPGGSNRLLVVGIATNSTTSGIVGDPTAISYDSISLIKATGNGATDGRMHTWLYYLKENVVMDNTSNTLNVTMGSGSIVNMTVWYAVYAGVDQTATYSTGNALNNSSGSGPAQLSSDMSVNAGEQAIYISSIHDAVATTLPVYSINPNWTSGGSNTGTYTGGGNNRAWKNEVAHRAVPSSNTSDNAATSTITPTGSIRYAMSAMSLPPFRTATTLTPVALTDTYGNISSLSALLVPAASGKTIVFTLNGGAACSSTTNSSGLAACNLSSPGLKINVGTYPSGVSASFAGDTFYIASSGTAALTVNKRSITVTAITNTKVYDGGLTALATPTHSGLAVGDTADFTEAYLDKNVGSGNKVLVPAGVVTDGNSGNNYDYTYTNFTFGNITPASSTVTVTCPLVAQTYTGSAIEPCDASYLTEDGLSEDLIPTYTDNVFVGIATATAIYDGDSNHDGSENSANFEIIDITAPVLTINGATADGVDMAGDLPTGYILESNNNPALDRLIQFKAGTAADETLASEYFGLKLIDSTVSAADIKAYYVARSVPEPFLTYLNDAADGINPFVYIDGSTVKLVDAAKHDILATDVDMTIPDDFPLGTYTVEGQIKDLAGNETTVTLILIVAGDRTAPVLTINGATADGVDMAGDLPTGYILESNNNPALDRLIQFKAGTAADETLASEYFGLKLIDSTVSAADIKAYYVARSVPEPFLTYLNDAADGINPFVYIDGSTVKLVDAAKHDILATDVDMTIPDDFPLGTYTVEGQIKDLAGNETTVTLKLIVITVQLAQTIDVTLGAPATAAYLSEFTVAATGGGSGNPIVYTSSGNCTNIGAVLTMTSGTGTCTVSYNQAGNRNYLDATEVTEEVSATKLTQTIDVTLHAPASAAYLSGFTVAATGGASGNSIVYGTSGVCSIVGADVTMESGTGTCIVSYNQAGNADFADATEVTEEVIATKLTQAIVITTHAPAFADFTTDFTVVAHSDSALVVAYSATGACSNTGGDFNVNNDNGSCAVHYNQAGDANFLAAIEILEYVTVTNDTIAGARNIYTVPYQDLIDTTFATEAIDDPALTTCGGEIGLASVWYKYDPSSSREVSLDTFASDYNTMIGVWSGAPGSLTLVACNDDAAGTSQSFVTFAATAGTHYYVMISQFDDAPVVNGGALAFQVTTFADTPGNAWYWKYVEGFYAQGITTGCALGPFRYCPDRAVTRAEMAVFILRAQNGASYVPDPVETGMFADVPVAGKEWMQPWIEQFYASGLTTGCAASPFQYCPEREVTRAEMAVFILRSIHGASYVPPAATGVFSDLPVAGKEWMQPWIEQLYAEGITTGCASAPLRYCPEQSVTRAEMATFIDRAFDFPTLP